MKANIEVVKDMVKVDGCTTDSIDLTHFGKPTAFFKRIRRLHINAYTRSIFASRDAAGYDAGRHQPQYIGRDEGDVDYRLKGLFVPLDPDGCEYYSNRRMEAANPELFNSTTMWKSKPADNDLPSRWSSRSKLGTHVTLAEPSSSSSKSGKPKPSQKPAAM